MDVFCYNRGNDMGIETMQDELKEALKILAEIASEIKVINEKIKRFDTVDERVTMLERHEAKSQGSIATIKWIVGALSGVFIVIATWLCSTTINNKNDVSLIVQRLGNIENTVNATHK